MNATNIRAFSDRKYKMIPTNKIEVLNSRNRNPIKFMDNVNSIKNIGLLKPIVVNERDFKTTGLYELVCGEGRYLAYKKLNRKKIPAELINCDNKEALLYSLVENIARVPPKTMWYAREIERMHDTGWTYKQISVILGKSESYVKDYVRLVKKGEERLIKGVEQDLFPISFALLVAKASCADVQDLLMEAFDSGLINTTNLQPVRKIIELRYQVGKVTTSSVKKRQRYTLKDLKKEISKVVKEKESYVNEVSKKESRLYVLISHIEKLWNDTKLLDLLKEEHLDQVPNLKGDYNFNPTGPFKK